jgi:hypothetical protein
VITTTTTAQPAHLDLLRLPAATDARFALLVSAVVGASLFAYDWLALALLRERFQAVYRTCGRQSTTPSALDACVEPFERQQAAAVLGGVALLFVVAAAIYWLLPLARIRRYRFVKLDADLAPDLASALAELCCLAGLRHPPIFLLDPLNPAAGGLAFGHAWTKYVVLQAGLVVQFRTNRPYFQAVVLHELAHLRNGDVDKTFFSLSVWYAFVAVALAPLGLSLIIAAIREDAAGLAFSLAARAGLLTAIVLATLASLLRTREVYADLRAAQWDRPGGKLRERLEALAEGHDKWWRRVFASHPAPALRRQILDDPRPLLRIDAGQAFGIGLIASIALPEVMAILALLLPNSFEQYAGLAAALLVGMLISSQVGGAVWRVACANLAGLASLPRATTIGAGLGLGLAAGQLLSLYMAVRPSPVTAAWQLSLGDLIYTLAWGALLVAGLALFARWLIDTAALWANRAGSAGLIMPAFTCVLGLGGLMLAVWIGVFATLLSWGAPGMAVLLAQLPLATLAGGVVDAPITQALLLMLWVVPIGAELSSRMSASRLKHALATGAAGGLATAVIMVCLRVIARLALPDYMRAGEAARELFVVAQIGLAILIQILTAFYQANTRQRGAWAYGLLAAWLTGWIAAYAAVALVQAGYCFDLLSFGPGHSCAERVDGAILELFAAPIAHIGALAALPAALAGQMGVLRIFGKE